MGARKQLSPDHGEVKSMLTAAAYLRRGAAAMNPARFLRILSR